ncbi:hypothetical protein [Mucilaginibacter sp.]|uniref:hypothetical protein n=1 Tax=Mucilaginibacter sp. TaxID=1882438 RepID=UPI003D0E7515
MAKPVIDKKNKTFILILLAWLLTGTLDAIAAMLWNYKTNAAIIFDFIASGYFGKAAFAGGTKMVLWGLFFHYVIAYVFTVAFYLAYPFFKTNFRNKYLIGVEYGLITWFVMNLIVIPLSKIGLKQFHVLPTVIGIAILIVCIGMPVALIADRHYMNRKLNK